MHRRPYSWPWVIAGIIPTLMIVAWGLLRSPQNAFDDAFITYRYAENLRNGLGLVYNPSEWVLGTTAPLYAILLGALSRLGLPVEWWGHWVSVAAWIVSAWTALGQLWQRRRYAAGIIAALAIAVLPLSVSVLGMETAFLLACLLLASWAWMGDRLVLAPVLSALAILTRQDAVLFVAVLFVARSLSHRRILWPQALAAAGLTLPWFAYALWRYGAVLPHSVLAKVNQNQFMEVAGSRSFIGQLAVHLTSGSVLVGIAIVISLAVGLYVIARHARAWWWLPVWVVLYLAAYTALNVATTFPWYYVPPLAGILLVCAIGLGHLLGDGRPAPVRAGGRVMRSAVALVCGGIVIFAYGREALAAGLGNRPGYLSEYRAVGTWLAENTRPTDRVAMIEIGVIGHLSRRPVLDTMGLVSPEMRGHLLGWEETLTYAVWQRAPDYLVTLTGTAWDQLTPEWWFQERYRPRVVFGRATIYQRQAPNEVPRYAVRERTEFEPGFAITGFEAPGRTLEPGTTLRFLLDVEVAQSPARDCQIILHLVNTATFELSGETKEQPFAGGYSCSAWQPGDTLRIPLQIDVPQDIAPGAYRLGIELFGVADRTYFPLKSNPDEQRVQLGWLRVGSPEPLAPATTESEAAVLWEGDIALVDATLPDQPVRPGASLAVRLAWQAGRTPERDLTFFVHLINAEGEIVAQTDRRPFDGRFPTTVWLPGETLRDTYTIPLPENLPPGEYTVRLGFYDAHGRLTLADGTTDHSTLAQTVLVAQP